MTTRVIKSKTDRPIIMSGPMVRALLDGRKTQTRRKAWRVKTRKAPLINSTITDAVPTIWQKVEVGDRLWCRETHKQMPRWHHTFPDTPEIMYADDEEYDLAVGLGWRIVPSIHMPRWASRLTLLVTETRMERFHEISEEDARASGFAEGRLDDGFGERPFGDTGLTISSPGTFCSAAGMAQVFYHDMHPDPLWDAYSSPECVALTFTVHQCNIDSMEEAA